MGGPLSTSPVAEIYLDLLEKEALKSSRYSEFLHTWARYMDDIFCVWAGSAPSIQSVLQSLNNFDPAMKFTSDIEGSCLNFLDFQISLAESQNVLISTFRIFRKPAAFTGVSIHKNTLHHAQHKRASINSAVNRPISIPLTPESEQREIQRISNIAEINGFHLNIPELVRNCRSSSPPQMDEAPLQTCLGATSTQFSCGFLSPPHNRQSCLSQGSHPKEGSIRSVPHHFQ